MELSDFYPAPNELIKSELAVLAYLRDNTFISGEHGQFAEAAKRYYSLGRNTNARFEFSSYIDIWHAQMQWKSAPRVRRRRPKPNIRLFLCARIEVEGNSYENVSYCLAVCRIKSNRLSILRKFHFDIAVASGDGQRRQPHPICHLQYCGKMLHFMQEMGCRSAQLDQMHPRLSEPRIFFAAMSLALLIDMSLHEFPNTRSEQFRLSPEWRGLVRSQEALVLRPFFKSCVEVIDDKNGSNRSLAEEFYLQ